MTLEAKSAAFIAIRCTCGRTLRAKADQVGTEIRCWDCRTMIMVSVPRERQRVARELSGGISGVIRGRGLSLLLASSAIVAAGFCVPRYGVWVAGAILVFGAALYGELIRRVVRAEVPDRDPGWVSVFLPRSPIKPLLWLLMAVGTVYPLWGMNYGYHRSPHWSLDGIRIAGATWLILPVAMLIVYGSDSQGRLGIAKCLGSLIRHPIATLLALAAVPASLALAELALGITFYVEGNLTFFTLEFLPIPGNPVMFEGVPHYESIDYRSYPPGRFIAAYFSGLRHGYSLSAAIPPSLSLPTRNGLNPSILYLNNPIYGVARFLLSAIISTFLLAGFAIQACWLGAIATVNTKRPS